MGLNYLSVGSVSKSCCFFNTWKMVNTFLEEKEDSTARNIENPLILNWKKVCIDVARGKLFFL